MRAGFAIWCSLTPFDSATRFRSEGSQTEQKGYCVQAAAEVAEAPAASGGEQKKLWGGRFTGKTDPLMEKFNESLPFDKRMWREDLQVGSISKSPQRLTTW